MAFTIHYCDRCGEKIREEELRSGAAVQFQAQCYCKECQEALLADTGFQRYLKQAHLGGGTAVAARPATRRRKRSPARLRARTAAPSARRAIHPAVLGAVALALLGLALLLAL